MSDKEIIQKLVEVLSNAKSLIPANTDDAVYIIMHKEIDDVISATKVKKQNQFVEYIENDYGPTNFS